MSTGRAFSISICAPALLDNLKITERVRPTLATHRVRARGQDAAEPGTGGASAPAWAPPVDISERKDAYAVTVDLPGVKVEDLDISFQDGLLTIQGQRSATRDPDEQFHVLERRYGLFRRSITLPLHVKADAIQASTEDGVLQVLVPKVEEVKPKRIEVQAVRTSEPTTVDAPQSTRP